MARGSVLTRELADGSKRYDVHYRADGKQRCRTYTKKHDADKFVNSTIKAVSEGTYQHVKPILMGDLFDKWITDDLEYRRKLNALKASTAKSYRSMIKEHLRPAFAEHRSDRLTHEVVSGWTRRMADAVAAGTYTVKTFRNLLNLLHAILGWAKEPARAYLLHDPLPKRLKLKQARVERRFLEPDDLDALIGAAESPDDTIIKVGAYTGVRRGELFALKWTDLEPGDATTAARLRIRRGIYQGIVSTPKTEHSERVVDIGATLVDELMIYKAMYPPMGEGYIFRTATGTPMDPDNWYHRRFTPTVDRAKLSDVGLHTLRHTYASILINQGENIKYVSRQLGHASIQITADLYGHLFKETSLAAMQRLDARIKDRASFNIHSTEPAKTGRTGKNRREDGNG